MDIHKIDWSTTEWKLIRQGVEQKAFSGSGATVALHRLMPGHEPRPHSHPHEQIAYIDTFVSRGGAESMRALRDRALARRAAAEAQFKAKAAPPSPTHAHGTLTRVPTGTPSSLAVPTRRRRSRSPTNSCTS